MYMQQITRKRRVFFSFHYQPDIIRVNQVRNSWRYQKPDNRLAEGFFDGSLWERSKRTSDDSLKTLIRQGLENTSVTVVLAGAQTWQRRWVRYEIARSVVKGNGLLTVHIDRLKNFQGFTSQAGPNPLDYMGIYNDSGSIRIAEKTNGQWYRYSDYTLAVDLPRTWAPPFSNNVTPLSQFARRACYVGGYGAENFSNWVRQAAADVGR